jgi:hypothetical protein
MDPLSVISGSIALGQVSWGIVQLTKKLKPFFDAVEEVDALTNEARALKILFDNIDSALQVAEGTQLLSDPPQTIDAMRSNIKSSRKILRKLETLLDKDLKTSSRHNDAKEKVNRPLWLKRSRKVNKLMTELRHSVTNISTHLGSIIL